jgi:hypothetical protein
MKNRGLIFQKSVCFQMKRDWDRIMIYQVALKGKDTSCLGQESLLNSTKTKHSVQRNGRRR